MEKLKQVLIKFPEYYLIGLAVLYGFTLPFSVNPVAIGLLIILTCQIILKNAITGLSIGSLFLLGNIYMLFALASEFSEFPVVNAGAVQLLLGGVLVIGANIAVSGLMIHKYSSKGSAIV